eukprot:scaffold9908_cov61-Attheya_sp.AAC.2
MLGCNTPLDDRSPKSISAADPTRTLTNALTNSIQRTPIRQGPINGGPNDRRSRSVQPSNQINIIPTAGATITSATDTTQEKTPASCILDRTRSIGAENGDSTSDILSHAVTRRVNRGNDQGGSLQVPTILLSKDEEKNVCRRLLELHNNLETLKSNTIVGDLRGRVSKRKVCGTSNLSEVYHSKRTGRIAVGQ